MTRLEAVELFQPYIREGNKVRDNYFDPQGIIFVGRYAYIINSNFVGRVLINDRLLPDGYIMWNVSTEECVEAPHEAVEFIANIFDSDIHKSKPIFVRKKDLCSFAVELTPKRKSKSVVTFSFENENVYGVSERKKNILVEKNFKTFGKCDFCGKIEISMFDFEKIALEIFSDYDIIGIQPQNRIMFCRRGDRTKPAIDFLARNGW